MSSRFLAIIFFFLFTTLACFSQERMVSTDEPDWVYLEKGKKAFREREFGIALRYFREAIRQKAVYPEAEYWIGKVFEEESEFGLAEKQYKLAYEQRGQLTIPDDKYTILYQLARIYQYNDDTTSYVEVLQAIVEDDKVFSSPEYHSFRTAINSTLREQGLNRLLILYRLQSDFSLQAHSALGIYNYEREEYKNATLHFLFTVITLFSNCITEIRTKRPFYEFENAADCLTIIMDNSLLKDYVLDNGLFVNMYYLASSLYAEGESDVSLELWRLVSAWTPSSILKQRTEQQLENPFVEPYTE